MRSVQKLVGVLEVRNASAQLKAAEALAVLAAKSDENRKAITAANAIKPLVTVLGDGRRVRASTPQERAAAVLADLARSGDNKKAIVEAGGVNPLVAMLSSPSEQVKINAAGALGQLAALGNNKIVIVAAGAIPLLVDLLKSDAIDAQRYSTGALWHLASAADNKTQMAAAGAIPLLVAVLSSKSSEAREHSAAVVSALSRSHGSNKKEIYNAHGIEPLVALLNDPKPVTQKHAACALWGLCDGKDGIYDKQIAEAGAIGGLVAMLQYDDPETRGFAAACLLCICKDPKAHDAIRASGAVEPLSALCYGPATWLRGQVTEMLTLLKVPIPDPDEIPQHLPQPIILANATPGSPSSPKVTGQEEELPEDPQGSPGLSPSGHRSGSPGGSPKTTRRSGGHASSRLYTQRPNYMPPLPSSRPLTGTARMKFHFSASRFTVRRATRQRADCTGLRGV